MDTKTGEKRAYDDHYDRLFGRQLKGLNFWLAEDPEVLHRYRAFSEATAHVFMPGQPESGWVLRSFSLHTYYALWGYASGLRYLVHLHNRVGLTKEQLIEGLGITFIHGGPRGSETIAEALAGYQWEIGRAHV